jgi:ferrous iron transport protein A
VAVTVATHAIQEGAMSMPLTLLRAGDSAKIDRVKGKDNIRSHLAELGFTPGVEVKVVSKTSAGVIINIMDSRVALDREMASRIMV